MQRSTSRRVNGLPESCGALVSLRRIGFLSAALTACSAELVEADDPKPSATGTTAPSGAGGGAPDEGGLALADPIRKIPVAGEQRTGYERDAFKHWVDEDDDGCPTRQEVLLAEAVTARSRVPGERSAEAVGCPTTTRPRLPTRGATATRRRCARTTGCDPRPTRGTTATTLLTRAAYTARALRSSIAAEGDRHLLVGVHPDDEGVVVILGRPEGRPPPSAPGLHR
ncbi:hypothetical protein ACF1D2_32165 [Streptomyces bacillaris]|uniref:hypothetical protein n=1 Tax=Streptomyces bacillaris TaxID=68179 RepID=UPI0037005F92